MKDNAFWMLVAIVIVGFLNMVTFPIASQLQNIVVSFVVIVLAILAMRHYPMEKKN